MKKHLTTTPFNCFILDFEDSFTYNTACILEKMGISSQIIPFSGIPNFLKNISKKKKKLILIYGPGPGHPMDYKSLFTSIKSLMLKKNIFHLGICLGHQILGMIRGYHVEQSRKPLHGQQVTIQIPPWPDVFPKDKFYTKTKVQRYNSLTIKPNSFLQERIILHEGEIVACHFERGISYQFHPESVGTSFPVFFFNPVKNFLYNEDNVKRNFCRWDL